MSNQRPPNPYAAPTPWASAAAAGGSNGQAWVCPSCRAENAAHYKFCLGCGASRDSAPNAAAFEDVPRARTGNPLVIVIVAVVAVLLAVIGGGIAMFLTMAR